VKGVGYAARQRADGIGAEASAIGEILSGFVADLGAPPAFDNVGEALAGLLPANLRAHCRVGAVSNGCLKLVADASSYVYELQLCSEGLLEEMQRLCPSARLRRIEVGIAR
jgi:hypothetical protein